MKNVLIICLLLLFSCKRGSEEQVVKKKDDSHLLTFFEDQKQPIRPKLERFPTGEVLPKGWIKKLMRQDLEKGIVGELDKLYPGIRSDDLYNTARRGGLEDIPEMGDLVLTGAEWEQSIMWWNAETIGNWWDGFIRYAFLLEDEVAIKKADAIVKNLLQSQDKDGYIGIYKPNLRYQHEGSNGELWAQTTAFRAMLAYYEFTRNNEVLQAVEKAMALTMRRYGEAGKNPFDLKNAFGGVTHGLMLTDVCETLYRITGDKTYQDYATYLYKAFSTHSINRAFNDLRYPFLMEKDSLFQGHAVHTYEHIRTLANAYYNTGYPQLEEAYQNMLSKLQPCLLPSGVGHGNEWISKLKADPDKTGTEFCAMLELRNSYGSLIQKTGDIHYADAAEKMTYNAMMGSRNKEGNAIAYGKHDNCYILNGEHHDDGNVKKDPRYKYSPTHSEPAVCCVPNYARNFSYFLDQMWLKSDKGIASILFGPSMLRTEIDGSKVNIEQITNYPFSDKITFKFILDKPKKFDFLIRKPKWSSGIIQNNDLQDIDDFFKATKEWKNGDIVTITFKNEISINKASNDEYYLQRGPLVYSYEIPYKREVIKEYDNSTFQDYYCLPINEDHKELLLTEKEATYFNVDDVSTSFYRSDIYLETEFFNTKHKNKQKIKLIPMGKTALRRITFPIKK